MICKICGEDDGNYDIWILPGAYGDTPSCYCPRECASEETKCFKSCYKSVTLYHHECNKKEL